MHPQAIADFIFNQKLATPRHILFNSRILIATNLFLLYPDMLLLGQLARPVHIIRGFFVLAFIIHSAVLKVSRRQSLVDGFIFMFLAGINTIAISLAVGPSQTRYIFSLALIFLWCATSVPTSPKAIVTINTIIIFLYIALSVVFHETGDLSQFFSMIFFLAASTYASFFLVKTSNRREIEQIVLKHKATEKANQLNEANLQLQKTSQQLRALDQAKSSFFANINHDLRTPLSLVMLNLQLAEEQLDPSFIPSVAGHLKNAHFNALRLYSLVKDILDLTSLDMEKFRLKLSEIDLMLMLRSLVHDVAALAMHKNIEVSLHLPPVNPFTYTVTADPDQIDRVFINLLTNAVQFTPSGGRVAVEVKPLEDVVSVCIQDSGPGISEAMLPHIFSRGIQDSLTKGSGTGHSTGLGIGLNLVKSIVTAHQGSVDVSNTLEGGAAFQVSLRRQLTLPTQSLDQRQRSVSVQHERRTSQPVDKLEERFKQESRLSRMHQLVAEAEQLVNPTTGTGSANVLIVEDNAEISKLLGDLLSTYNLSYAPNGTQGLEMARRSRPDLIITDNMMEGGDGISFTTNLRADSDLQNVPIIMITGSSSLDHQRQASQQGIDAFLSKPFDVHVVTSTVSRLLARERRYAIALMERNRESLAFFVQGLAHNVLNALNNISGSLTIGLQHVTDLLRAADKDSNIALINESQSNYSEGMDAITRVHQSIIALQRCVDDSKARQPEVDQVENLVRRALLAAGGKEMVNLQIQGAFEVRAQLGQIERAVVDLLRVARGSESDPHQIKVLVGSTQDSGEVFVEISAHRREFHSDGTKLSDDSSNFAALAGGDLVIAVVRMVVRNHNGRLDVANDPILGTRYRITLPLARQAARRSP